MKKNKPKKKQKKPRKTKQRPQKFKIKIVKYSKKHEKSIRNTCWQTAFFGKSGKRIIEDKKLITDFLCDYYLIHEADKCFVALHKNKVVGYLFGCTDTKKQEKTFNRKILPNIMLKIIRKHYKFGVKTLQFLFGGLIWFALFEGKLKTPRGYPAHLHMNIKKTHRRKGIGTALVIEYLKYLIKHKIKGLHLITTSHHKLANPFYKKLGFKLFNKKPTKMWSDAVKETVYFRVYQLGATKTALKRIENIFKTTDIML